MVSHIVKENMEFGKYLFSGFHTMSYQFMPLVKNPEKGLSLKNRLKKTIHMQGHMSDIFHFM